MKRRLMKLFSSYCFTSHMPLNPFFLGFKVFSIVKVGFYPKCRIQVAISLLVKSIFGLKWDIVVNYYGIRRNYNKINNHSPLWSFTKKGPCANFFVDSSSSGLGEEGRLWGTFDFFFESANHLLSVGLFLRFSSVRQTWWESRIVLKINVMGFLLYRMFH